MDASVSQPLHNDDYVNLDNNEEITSLRRRPPRKLVVPRLIWQTSLIRIFVAALDRFVPNIRIIL